ncbi:MAG: WG repeat-containing protein [Clostridia bacterium]|nr:WG repeat-containing protein [Clostridia bacterium]
MENWGIIDTTGKEIVPCMFDEIFAIEETERYILCHKGGWKDGCNCIFDVDAGEIVFKGLVSVPPGGLAEYGRGPVPLGLPLHGHEAQMVHPGGHPQRRQPVSLQLVVQETHVPLQHSVHFAHQAFTAQLPYHGFRLLDGGELLLGAEYVHPRQLLGAVLAHGLAQRQRLGIQRALGHEVAGVGDKVLFAPGAYTVTELPGEALRHVLVVPVSPG